MIFNRKRNNKRRNMAKLIQIIEADGFAGKKVLTDLDEDGNIWVKFYDIKDGSIHWRKDETPRDENES